MESDFNKIYEINQHACELTAIDNLEKVWKYLSQCMRFPTMWYVRPAKAQISLGIHTVWSEPLLTPWIFYEC